MATTNAKTSTTKKAAFAELGLKGTIEELKAEIRELYLADDVPWIIGYSGGKDSTAVLQLTWLALAEQRYGQPAQLGRRGAGRAGGGCAAGGCLVR